MSKIHKLFSELLDDHWNKAINDLNIQQNNGITIFGCGLWGKRLYERLKLAGYTISSFCDNNAKLEDSFDNVRIYKPDRCIKRFRQNIYILAVKEGKEEMRSQLQELGISDDQIRLFQPFDMGEMKREYFDEHLTPLYRINTHITCENILPAISVENVPDAKHIRVHVEDGLISTYDKGVDPFDHDIIKEYEDSYGSYKSIDDFPSEEDGKTKVKILISCSHKDYSKLIASESAVYEPIQVGKALTNKRLYPLTDDTGESISDRNYNYSECTALYWIWKNAYAQDYDYIGLRHYRRGLRISEMQISSLKENNIDIVHTEPIYHDRIQFSFANHTKNPHDWIVMKDAIRSKHPEYIKTMDKFENQHFLIAYNITIMRRDIFDEYAEFLFSILMDIEDYYLKRCDRRDRYLGYLAENLTSLFIMHGKDRFKTAIANMVKEE